MFKRGRTNTLPLSFFRETQRNNELAKYRASRHPDPLGAFANGSQLIVRAKNTLGKPIRRFGFATLGDMLFDETHSFEDEDAIPTFELRTPANHPLETPCVALEPLPVDDFGRFIVRGFTPALVTSAAVGNVAVRPIGSATEYGAQPFTDNPSPVRIVHPGTGDLSLVELAAVTNGWVFETPSGGIDARSSNTPGSATCAAYYIDENDELAPLLDFDTNPITRTVWHIGESAIGGEIYIQAKESFGRILADVEYCPAS